MYISGPEHGAPATLANCYLEGHYSEIYPDKSCDEAGMLKFFRQFSFPGGIGSHCTPETPGSIHEGGELGYSLSHAYGAAFDNPDLIVAVAVGDGEAETGPLATSWHSNKFLNPIRDGAVLPVLHLNGYKIANPTILARIPHDELEALLTGYGHKPYFVEGHDPSAMHRAMAAALRTVRSRDSFATTSSLRPATLRARWPMIVLRSPKGWTEEVDGRVEQRRIRSPWRSRHECGQSENRRRLVAQLQTRRTIRQGWNAFVPELRELAPSGPRRISANPRTNGGTLRKDLICQISATMQSK